ncbi:MAG TPA: hypothetical protein VGU63_06365 [Candidatus Acidoferrales bacterium]|nr:hypothetical protein [Candidatus Acidoferrales bacterium]
MTEPEPIQKSVEQFILDEIDTVPHLEALLMLCNTAGREWTVDEMAKSLYISPDAAQRILQSLTQRRLIEMISGTTERYRYRCQSEEQDALLRAVDATYRRELVRVSTMIHSKASPAVREFARAFRFTREKDKE